MVLWRIASLFGYKQRPKHLIFVHGFNNTPSQIKLRVTGIREHIKPGTVKLISQHWQSVAGLAQQVGLPEAFSALLYPLDNILTKAFVGRQLRVMRHFNNGTERMSVLAHSRGNAVVVHWLLRNPSEIKRIHRFGMLHPDIDSDSFSELPEDFRYNKVKVFDTKGDYATTFSGLVDGTRDLRPHVKQCSRVWTSFSHNYWVDDPEAVKEVVTWALAE
jgi:esterase/lipase superfamily enzyme